MVNKYTLLGITMALLAACNTGPGPDSISSHGTATTADATTCDACHNVVMGTRRQIVGTGGDFSLESHHVINYANRTSEIVTNDDCVVCHDMTQHMTGTVWLNNKDTAGLAVEYVPGDPASLEPFCLSCHDSLGATTETSPLAPFSSNNTLGAGLNVAGNKIADYWNSSNPVHKNNGLTCAGTGAINTGCHGNNGAINMHGSASRGLLAQNLTSVISPTAAYNANDYRLCFDCHSSYPAVTKEVVLGYSLLGNYGTMSLSILPQTPYDTPIQSLFRDQYKGGTTAYDDTLWGDPFLPLHNYHLMGVEPDTLFGTTLPNVLLRNYRGDTAQSGRITCTSCHNVHGANSTVRSTYEELGITTQTTGTDTYGSLPISLMGTTIMQTYPMSCSIDCHTPALPGVKSYWHTPSNE